MLTAAKTYLFSGNPPHYQMLAATLWVMASWTLSKLPSKRANTLGEALANKINPYAIPFLKRWVPGLGPALAAFLDLFDTPKTVGMPPALPPVSVEVPTLVKPSILVLAFLGLALSACAPGTDGLRQACANADTVITGGYQVAVSWYQADQGALRASVKDAASAAKAEVTFKAHQAIATKTLDALDAAVASKRAICDLIPAIDAGAKANLPALMGQILSLANDVRNATTLIMGAL